MFWGMEIVNLRRAARGRLRAQSGAFDLPSIMIGVAVVAILTVGVLAAIFGVIPWSQDKAAQQDLGAVHTAQGAAFAKDGGFMDRAGLADAGFLVDNPADGLEIQASDDGRKYIGVSTSATGNKFVISAEAPTSRPLTSQDKWPDGQPIDPSAPDAPAVEAGPADNSAILATYTCDIFTLNITQAMQDFSDANQELKDTGKADEMVAYPGGGWKIIVDAAGAVPGFVGVFMTVDGEHDEDAGNVTNSAGPAAVYSYYDGEACSAGMFIDGKPHSVDGPAYVSADGDDIWLYAYFIDGKLHRTDGLAQELNHSDGTPKSGLYYLNNTLYTDRNEWILAGGQESGWPL